MHVSLNTTASLALLSFFAVFSRVLIQDRCSGDAECKSSPNDGMVACSTTIAARKLTTHISSISLLYLTFRSSLDHLQILIMHFICKEAKH